MSRRLPFSLAMRLAFLRRGEAAGPLARAPLDQPKLDAEAEAGADLMETDQPSGVPSDGGARGRLAGYANGFSGRVWRLDDSGERRPVLPVQPRPTTVVSLERRPSDIHQDEPKNTRRAGGAAVWTLVRDAGRAMLGLKDAGGGAVSTGYSACPWRWGASCACASAFRGSRQARHQRGLVDKDISRPISRPTMEPAKLRPTGFGVASRSRASDRRSHPPQADCGHARLHGRPKSTGRDEWLIDSRSDLLLDLEVVLYQMLGRGAPVYGA